jgi:hypothetical protein
MINRFPEGLLALLDLKTRGQAPGLLSDTVNGELPMLPFYELGQVARWYNVFGNAVAGSANIFLQVPAGEVWLVRALNLRVTCTAAGAYAGALLAYAIGDGAGVQPGAVRSTSELGDGGAGLLTMATGQIIDLPWQPSQPLLAGPGTNFSAIPYTVSIGTFSQLVQVLCTKYKA